MRLFNYGSEAGARSEKYILKWNNKTDTTYKIQVDTLKYELE